MLDTVSALAFAVFVAAGLRLWRANLPESARRHRINVFLLVVLANSFAAGLTQRELWPFSSWPLVAGTLAEEVTHGRLVAVDANGAEHNVDYRAWEPLGFDELMAWMNAVFLRLHIEDKNQVAAYLLSRAESARKRALLGEPIGSSERFLGPLAAPYFILHPRRWADWQSVPATELIGLRYYHETWNLETRAGGSREMRRLLLYQFSRE